ncbi:hypothetical protein BU26DRAFT_607235 [Trematosphaeria pertusa]|uniref:Tat pathway signal sequence n=1 Tax=Trematosphaeria pertusa TaxID=390896 RepID=A0A6A6I6F8_9PLEO|nr:uncharacterized protein BU26DRAFT_607235 [Trematosphaeria pertusa]KAF2245941.1 hypothetical protein BU26DRAFT_607235 [Trematosphaeria pertusa]
MSSRTPKYSPLREKPSFEQPSSSTPDSPLSTEHDTFLERYSDAPTQNHSWLARARREPILLSLYIVNTVFLISLISLVARNTTTQCEDPSLRGLYSPLNDAVRYKNAAFKKGFITDMSAYMGWPTDKKDELWTDLYRYMPVRVPKTEAHRLPNKTAHLTVDGWEEDYMVGIDVFHQLHCLNVLRRSFYPQRYRGMGMWHPNGTLNMLGWVHIDHCIESLRQSLQCSADIAPIPFTWMPERKYMLLRMDTYHRCRDFDALHAWTRERQVGEYSESRHVEGGRVVDYAGMADVLAGVSEEELRRVRWDLPAAVREGRPWDGE